MAFLAAACFLLLPIAAFPATTDQPEKVTIAVMDFTPNNASRSEAAAVTSFVRSALFRVKMFTVVDKGNMDKILQEQAFQQTGCTSQECAVKLGKLLNVKKIIVGEYTVLGNMRFMTASLVDVESGEIEQAGKVKGFSVENADEVADQLVGQLTATTPSSPVQPRQAASMSKISAKGERTSIVSMLTIGKITFDSGVGVTWVQMRERIDLEVRDYHPLEKQYNSTPFSRWGRTLFKEQWVPGLSLDISGKAPLTDNETFGLGALFSFGIIGKPASISGTTDYVRTYWEWNSGGWWDWKERTQRATIEAKSANYPLFANPRLFAYVALTSYMDLILGVSYSQIFDYKRKIHLYDKEGNPLKEFDAEVSGEDAIVFDSGIDLSVAKHVVLKSNIEIGRPGNYDEVKNMKISLNSWPRINISLAYRF